jgi:hypothetical protein
MKTIINISISDINNTVSISFFNDIMKGELLTLSKEDFTTITEFKNEIQSKLNNLPKTKANVEDINFLDDTFSISGDFYPLKTQKVDSLTSSQIAIVDSLKAFVLSYTGQPLISLKGRLGTHSVTINGTLYDGQAYIDLVAASNGAIVNAILLTIEIFNS